METVDVFRVLPLRLVGFSFGMAHAAAYRFPTRKVELLNNVGAFFVVCHISYCGIAVKSIPVLFNTIFFELICTCTIPTIINYNLCSYIANVMWDRQNVPLNIKRWGPFVAGFLPIPLLVTLFDPQVDNFLNTHIKP